MTAVLSEWTKPPSVEAEAEVVEGLEAASEVAVAVAVGTLVVEEVVIVVVVEEAMVSYQIIPVVINLTG